MQIKVIFASIIFFNIFTSSLSLAMELQPAIAPHTKRSHSCLENPRVSYIVILDELEEAVINKNIETVQAILAQFHMLPINKKISRLETNGRTSDRTSFTLLETAVIRFNPDDVDINKSLKIIQLLLGTHRRAIKTPIVKETLKKFPNDQLEAALK